MAFDTGLLYITFSSKDHYSLPFMAMTIPYSKQTFKNIVINVKNKTTSFQLSQKTTELQNVTVLCGKIIYF